ncbi:MFS general substrate transporter [Gonapodya prolifera JEL478]|uniref:MFS general substrate transporter n=1 Tax=Gonapodya prolifera (strain JEL478) TaxID=1344416 RepID=A0A139ASC0_GONPJ|nr:MFS general substrate transporter [Gonapodya prolifera JEL478]|eukprot:KXS19648.1 MFS general substrate transporter [Gonapodya prolifera JEL478]
MVQSDPEKPDPNQSEQLSTHVISLDAHSVSDPNIDSKLVDSTPELAPPDGGYGWAIVAANFFLNFFCIGFNSIFGLFQKNYLLGKDFSGSTNLQISVIGSIQIAGITVLAPLAGQLSDMYGPSRVAVCGALLSVGGYIAASFSTSLWHLYLSQGLMFGLGSCFSLIPATAVLPGWFTKHRGLASGIATAGTGVAGLILAPITQKLLDVQGWRNTLRVLAALAATMMLPSSWALRPYGRDVSSKQGKLQLGGGTARVLPRCFTHGIASPPPTLPLALLRSPSFLLTSLTITLTAVSFFAPQAYIPLALHDGGYDDATGSAVLSGFAGLMAVARVGMGGANDRLGTLNVSFGSQFFPALAEVCLWLPGPTSLGWTLAFMFLWAPFSAELIVALALVSAKLWAGKNGVGIGQVVGLLYMAFFPGDLAGQPLLGVLVDAHTTFAPDGTRLSSDYRPMLLLLFATWAQSAVTIGSIKMIEARKRVGVREGESRWERVWRLVGYRI